MLHPEYKADFIELLESVQRAYILEQEHAEMPLAAKQYAFLKEQRFSEVLYALCQMGGDTKDLEWLGELGSTKFGLNSDWIFNTYLQYLKEYSEGNSEVRELLKAI